MTRPYRRRVPLAPEQSVETVTAAVVERPTRAEEHQSERRRKRGDPVLSGLKLQFDRSLFDEKKFNYRVINDDGRRIQSLTELDDYELVDDPKKMLKSDGTDLGTKASIIVGKDEYGKPMRGYLARKLKTWYDADQREKSAKNMETMAAIATPKGLEGRSYEPTSRRLET